MDLLQAKQLTTRSETCRLLQGCQERSQQRFPLSDLLSVPIQRFLKYPLLTKVRWPCDSERTLQYSVAQAPELDVYTVGPSIHLDNNKQACSTL